MFLDKHRWCRPCAVQGRKVRSSVVDHIRPHRGDRQLFFDEKNWQALCKPCHDTAAKIKDHDGHMPGVSVDGSPVDQAHPWHERRGDA